MNYLSGLYLAIGSSIACTFTFGNPSGAVVTHGDVSFSVSGNTLQIDQTSSQAIIEWNQFSIASGELTRFVQPGANSAVLNRVIAGNPSEIHGQLQANGKVFLINPNGIFVGPGGRIDAGGGFVASTLDIPDADFLNGGDNTFSGSSTAAVANLGKIVAAEGDIILISAGQVTNAGTLEAQNGVVGLAAGTHVLVKSTGDKRILVQAASQEGQVNHEGLIRAAQVELSAVGRPEALAVNATGIIEATGVRRSGGRVMLTAGIGDVSVSGKVKATRSGDGGTVKIDTSGNATVTGAIDASGSDGEGGRVEITGDEVVLGNGASVDVSGTKGGGDAFIGGGFQGNNPSLRNAKSTVIESGVVVRAMTGGTGDGGRVIVWADETTHFRGHVDVSAKIGNGGFIEISGKDHLFYRGSVDLSSNRGAYGTLLLDPTNVIVINGAAGAGANSGELADGVINTADGGAVDFTITTGDIAAVGGNVLIQATNNINAAAVTITAPGDIAFTAGNDIALGDLNAEGDVSLVAGNNVSFTNINTTPSSFGTSGGDVTIIFNNLLTGNNIIARGSVGVAPGQSGGNGGAVSAFDTGGGGTITLNSIQNAGGDGSRGLSTTPGGNGGNGGLVSLGNGVTPSASIVVPTILYGGGDGGSGNPPGSGGAGGSLFVNNATAVPDNVGPAGIAGSLLLPPPSIDFVDLGNGLRRPRFSPQVEALIAGESQNDIFATTSSTDAASFGSGLEFGQENPFGFVDFGFNGGQFPNQTVSIFDPVSGRILNGPDDFTCFVTDEVARSPFFPLALAFGLDPLAIEDFIDEVLAEAARLHPEDREAIIGDTGEAPRAPNGEVTVTVGIGNPPSGTGFFARARALFSPNREEELAGGEFVDPPEFDRNPAPLRAAIVKRDAAAQQVAAAEDKAAQANKAIVDAEENEAKKREAFEAAKQNVEEKKKELAEAERKLADVNRRLNALLRGVDRIAVDAEGRAAFRDQAVKLDREARQLRGAVRNLGKEVGVAKDAAEQARANVAIAREGIDARERAAGEARAEIRAAKVELKIDQNRVDFRIQERDADERRQRRRQDIRNAVVLAQEERVRVAEMERALEEQKKRDEFASRIIRARREERDSSFARAKPVNVTVDAQTRDLSTNQARLVQENLISSGEVVSRDSLGAPRATENPLDTSDARSLESPIITELFDRKEVAIERNRFLVKDDSLELSLRDFVDTTDDVDFFQEIRLNERGDARIITQTFVDKNTGDFVTTETTVAVLVRSQREGPTTEETKLRIESILSGLPARTGGRVIRGRILTTPASGANATPSTGN